MEKDSEIYKEKKERVKSIALKNKKEYSDDETSTSGSDDEEYAMSVRNFKKFFRRKGRFVRQPREEKKSFRKMDDKKGKSDRKCFRCGDPNYLIGECHRSNNYSESKRNDHLDNNHRQEQRNKGAVTGSGDVLFGRRLSLIGWSVGNSVFTYMESDGQCLYGKFESIQSLYMCEFESFMFHIVIGLIVLAATEFAYWAPNIESMEVNSESNPLERKDAEGPSLDESLENEEHLDVDSCDSDSLRMLTTDSVSPSSRVLQEEDVRGVESDLVDSFEEGGPVMSSSTVSYTDSESWRFYGASDEELFDVPPPSLDYVPGPEHPPSLDYVSGPEHPPLTGCVPELEYPKYLVPSGDEAPMEDQPLPDDASPTALSLSYVADSDPDEDLEEDPEEDHADYPADGGDGDDESSDDDDDDDDADDEDEKAYEDKD
ncbi:hypothetical protein Tco_0676767 [Tanacetum coccineum]